MALPSWRLIPAVLLASLSLSTQAVAQTAGTCLTDAEAHKLVLYALPGVADQLGDACKANLPATAYLIQSRQTLIARFDKSALSSAAGARLAFAKLAGVNSTVFEKLDNTTLRTLIGAGIASAMGKGIKAGECRIINDVLEQLDPLPPENLANLIGVALREAGKKPDSSAQSGSKPERNPFRICGTE